MIVGNGGTALTSGVAGVDKRVRKEEFGRHFVERSPRLSVFDQNKLAEGTLGIRTQAL